MFAYKLPLLAALLDQLSEAHLQLSALAILARYQGWFAHFGTEVPLAYAAAKAVLDKQCTEVKNADHAKQELGQILHLNSHSTAAKLVQELITWGLDSGYVAADQKEYIEYPPQTIGLWNLGNSTICGRSPQDNTFFADADSGEIIFRIFVRMREFCSGQLQLWWIRPVYEGMFKACLPPEILNDIEAFVERTG
ncbi:hypothetical protein L218DRAFT_951497 [Marasmius fiardii PR-910]|nr:hypothetical protein L218DRAFT_951497 [Marasmius fiardii PR-910]